MRGTLPNARDHGRFRRKIRSRLWKMSTIVLQRASGLRSMRDAYSGAVLAAYYDSLLVKVRLGARTFLKMPGAWTVPFEGIPNRGVKTNIPFVENVVNHRKVRAGESTTLSSTRTRAIPFH